MSACSIITADSIVTDEDVANYKTDGFLKFNFKDLIGVDNFSRLRAAVLDAESKAIVNKAKREDGNCAAEVFTRLFYLAEKYEDVANVVRCPEVGRLAARLAGVQHMRCWIDEIFFKPPHNAPCTWHQDLPHFPMDRRGLLTIWVAIEDVTKDMGPMHYIPGSHRLGPLGRGSSSDARESYEEHLKTQRGADGPEDYLFEGAQSELGSIKSFTLRAGEAVVHDGLTLHASFENCTERVRKGWACVYFPADTQYTGMPRMESDNLGLIPFKEFDHPRFAVVA